MAYMLVGMFLSALIILLGWYLINKTVKQEIHEYHEGFRIAQEYAFCKMNMQPYRDPQNSYEEGWNEAIKTIAKIEKKA